MPGGTFSMEKAYAAFGVRASDGVMTADGPNPRLLTSAGGGFDPDDAGKPITVEGAGAAGADLETTIARYISATQVELKDPALTTVAGSDISYAQGIYRLSHIIAQGDVDGNRYQIISARRLQIQVSSQSPGSKIFIGGPGVSPTNHGIELGEGESDNSEGMAVTTADYLTSETADQKVNIYFADDMNIFTPAP